MTRKQGTTRVIDVKALLGEDENYLRTIVQAIVQATLEAEMTAAFAAEKGERTSERLGYRSGYYMRALITRVGTLELRVPQDRDGRFSTRLFERYQRSEKALVGALAEMYVQGVSTRKSLSSDLIRGSRRSPRSCAGTRSRPPPSATSTRRSTTASRPLPSGGLATRRRPGWW